MSLDKNILDKIERENLKIRPRWFFAVKNFLFGIGTLSISILGSLSLALFFEIMANQGKNLTLLTIPYLYLILLGAFLLASYWLVIKVGSLYKMRFVPVVALLFFISLSFGYLAFASGKAEKIEKELEKIPIYNKIVPTAKKTSPESDETPAIFKERKNIGNDKEKKDNVEVINNNRVNEDNDNKVNDSKLELKNENNNSESASLEKTQSADTNNEKQSESGGSVTEKSASDKAASKTIKARDKKSDSHKDATPPSEDASDEE